MDIVNEVFAKIEAIVKLILEFLKGIIPEKNEGDAEADAEA